MDGGFIQFIHSAIVGDVGKFVRSTLRGVVLGGEGRIRNRAAEEWTWFRQIVLGLRYSLLSRNMPGSGILPGPARAENGA